MTPRLIKALIEKNLWVQKSAKVQGSVKIHFPSPKIQDIVLVGWEPVDVFARIGMTADQIKLSNLEDLVMAGDLQVVAKPQA